MRHEVPYHRRHAKDHSLAVGVVAALVLLAVACLAFTKSVPFVHGYRIEAVFSSSGQLHENAPVRIAGVDAGHVVGFKRGPGAARVAVLELRKSARPIHTDATARIRPRLFLEGSMYVELRPGSPSAPELADGGRIPLSRTSVPIGLNQVFEALNRPSRDAAKRVLAELDTALAQGGAQGLARAYRMLPGTLKDSTLIAQALRGARPHDLADVVRSTSRLTAAMAAQDGHLAGAVTHLNQTAAALAADDDALGAGVRELRAVLRQAPRALNALDGALPGIERFTRTIRPSLRIAPPVLDRGAALLAQLDRLAGPAELPRLVTRVRPAVRRLPGLERSLQTLFSLVTPVTDCVRDRVVPVLNAKLDDGSLSTGRPVWQDLVHGLAGVASAAQSFDGNGYYIRLLGIVGDQALSLTSVPGFSQLVGRASEAIAGVRPRWLGPNVPLPLRPDQPCRDQPAPNLAATASAPRALRAGPAPARRAARHRPSDLARLLREAPLLRGPSKLGPASSLREHRGKAAP